MKILQFMILSLKGRIIFIKKYDASLSDYLCEQYIIKLKASNYESTPITIIKNTKFSTIFRNELFYIVVSKQEMSSIYAHEVLQKTYDLIYESFKSTNEVILLANDHLINELLDKIMEDGHIQYVNMCQIKPIKRENNSTTAPLLTGSNMITSFGDLAKKCDVYLDVIEKLSVLVNDNDELLQLSITGQVLFKCESYKYLSDLKLVFNSTVTSNTNNLGFDDTVVFKRVVLDGCACVHTKNDEQILTVKPTDENITLMTYDVANCVQGLPIRVSTKMENITTSKHKLLVLTVRCELPSNSALVNNLVIELYVSEQVTSVQQIVENQSVPLEYSLKDSRLRATIKSLKGKDTTRLSFKLTTTDAFDQSQLGPMNLNFEVANYACSGLLIKSLSFENILPDVACVKWMRYATLSSSYVVDVAL